MVFVFETAVLQHYRARFVGTRELLHIRRSRLVLASVNMLAGRCCYDLDGVDHPRTKSTDVSGKCSWFFRFFCVYVSDEATTRSTPLPRHWTSRVDTWRVSMPSSWWIYLGIHLDPNEAARQNQRSSPLYKREIVSWRFFVEFALEPFFSYFCLVICLSTLRTPGTIDLLTAQLSPPRTVFSILFMEVRTQYRELEEKRTSLVQQNLRVLSYTSNVEQPLDHFTHAVKYPHR